jgi:hypothetical protein
MGKVIHYFEIEFNLMQFAVKCCLFVGKRLRGRNRIIDSRTGGRLSKTAVTHASRKEQQEKQLIPSL